MIQPQDFSSLSPIRGEILLVISSGCRRVRGSNKKILMGEYMVHRNPSQVDKADEREKRSPRRAANLIYDVSDSVPVSSLIPLVAQQVTMLSVDLIFPVLIVAAVSGTVEMAQTAVSMMMISMGIGTILQARRNGPVGSGSVKEFVLLPCKLKPAI